MKNLLARASKLGRRPACGLHGSVTSSHNPGRAYLACQTSANRTVGATFLIQEVNEVDFGATTLVTYTLLVILGEKLDSREALDFISLSQVNVFLVITIDVGDNALKNVNDGQK